jgi:mutator protein MutT
MGGELIEVAAGLVFREGKLLITQRYAEAHLGGLWEFPGGKREPDESFEDCLKRELKEELGIVVQVGRLIESLSHAYPEKTVLLRFYNCRWLEREPEKLGCPDFRWVSREQLSEYPFPEADARLVQKLKSEDALWG